MGSVIMTSPISSLSCCPRSRPSRAQQHHTHQPNYESASECETETNLSRRAWSRLSCVLTRATKHDLRRGLTECTIQLSATDVLAPTSMKNAAKCDTSCELQNPVNHQNFERTLRFRDIPGSMPVGVSAHTPLTPLGESIKRLARSAVESERRFTLLHVKVKRPSKSRPAHTERAFQDFGTCCLVFGSLRPVHCGCGKFSRTPSPACREKSDSWDRVHFVVVRRSLPCQDLEGLET